MLSCMSNYGQQPPPYGQNPYAQPGQYGQPQPPYARPGQPAYGQQPPYPGQPNPYGGQQAGPQPGQDPYSQGYGQQQAWPPPAARPQIASRPIVVVTLDAVPGRVVTRVLGEVVGVVARSRDLPPELRGVSQLDGYAVMLTQSRQQAVDQLVEMAAAAGADAVLGLRYDSSEITQSLSEVVAYGTAVTLNPVAGADDGPQQAVQPLVPPDQNETAGMGGGSAAVEEQSAQAEPTPSGSSPYAPPGQSWPPPRE